jgi:hypothetical protein
MTDDHIPPAPDQEPLEEPGLVAEYFIFLKQNRKWWLLPILVLVALLGGLLFFGPSPIAPFNYTLFWSRR